MSGCSRCRCSSRKITSVGAYASLRDVAWHERRLALCPSEAYACQPEDLSAQPRYSDLHASRQTAMSAVSCHERADKVDQVPRRTGVSRVHEDIACESLPTAPDESGTTGAARWKVPEPLTRNPVQHDLSSGRAATGDPPARACRRMARGPRTLV